jgi:hypothetical protein
MSFMQLNFEKSDYPEEFTFSPVTIFLVFREDSSITL